MSGGRLGFPVSPATQAQHPRTKTDCVRQLFEGPSDYGTEVCDFLQVTCGATVVSSEKHGTFSTWGGIGEFSELGWRDRGWQGIPVEDAVQAGPSSRTDGSGATGWRQGFENGTVYSSDKTGTIRVPRRWAGYLRDRGDADGPMGFPASPELAAATSPQGTSGRYQRFEGIWDYPDDIVRHWSDRESPGGATVYYSKLYGAHTVERGNGILYERRGGTASWLGFPTSDEVSVSEWTADPDRTVQQFEGGAIFYAREYESVPVKRTVIEYLAKQPFAVKRLGFPTGEAEPLPSGEGDDIQFFEHGVVTARNDVIEVWLAPGS